MPDLWRPERVRNGSRRAVVLVFHGDCTARGSRTSP